MSERSLFLEALDITDPAERAAFLDRACNGDAALRKNVEGLLAANDQSGSFMCEPAGGNVTSDHRPSEGPGSRVGPYKLLQEIGEGGMGVVYMAEQEVPVRRKVALKIIKPGMDSKQVVARFEAERQALGMMDHPNIAKVFDAGTTDSGRPYFVMELVHGVPITEYCDANKLTPRERLELFVPICQAIQHAHMKGIVHRDIKPSNILVTMYDDKAVPKVIDFGVAKAVEQRLTDKTLFTQYGALVGTFEYMSPEQAEMNAFGVDTRSDIYSLGVLLYELLTGTTPLERQRVRTAALGEVVRLIREEEAPRPSVRLSTSGVLAKVAAARKTEPGRLSALVRGELDWIAMRCLEKDRTRRYETANALARDVQRYLAGDAVEACPPSLTYRLKKTARRHKAALVTVGLVAAALVVGLVASLWQAVAATAARAEANRQRELAEVQEQDARASAVRLAEAEKARRLALADTYAAFGRVAADRDDPGLAALWYAHAARLTPDDPARADNYRLLASTWNQQAPRPVALFQVAHAVVTDLRWHPSGRFLAAHAEPFGYNTTGTAVVYDLPQSALWQPQALAGPLRAVAWNPAGDRVALADDGAIVLARFPDGAVEHRVAGVDDARALAFSPDGNWLGVAAGKTARLIDARTGKPAGPPLTFDAPVQSVVFHPKSDRCVVTTTGQPRSNHWLYPVAAGELKPLHPRPIPSLSSMNLIRQKLKALGPLFVDDGAYFVTQASTGGMAFRSAATGEMAGVRSTLPPRWRQADLSRRYSPASEVALSPDGRYLFAENAYTTSVLMDVAARTLTRAEIRHNTAQNINAADFSPHGRTLATGGGDRAVRFWAVPDGEPEGGPINLPATAEAVRYSPDGRSLAVGLDGGQVRVYRLPGSDARQREIEVPNATSTLARLSADGRHLLPTGNNRRTVVMPATRVYDTATGRPTSAPFEPGGQILDADLSPTEPLAAVVTSHPSLRQVPDYSTNRRDVLPGQLHLWAWPDGKERCPPVACPAEPRSVAFAPDGRAVAVLCSDGHVLLVDARDGTVRRKKVVRPATPGNNWYYSNGKLAYGPGGRTVWVYTMENRARVLDAETLDQKFALEHVGFVEDVHFSADGKLAATASRDGTARVWDATTGRPLSEPLSHPDWVFRAPFSPDGTKLLTAGRDGTARLWDWQDRRELFALEHKHEVHAVAFTPDGRRLLTASDDRTARLWDAHSGRPLSQPLDLPEFGLQALVTPDGRHAVVSGFSPRVQVFDLTGFARPDPLPDDDLIAWGELASGKRVENGTTFNLTAAQWVERWGRVSPRYPEPGQEPAADQLATHRREAHANVEARQWAAALPHLEALLKDVPRDQSLLLRRGKAHAELGRFDAAYADYAAAWDVGNLPSYEIQRVVLLALAGNDRAAAGKLLDRWAAQVLRQDDRPAGQLVLWTFTLSPDIPADVKQLERLADTDASLPFSPRRVLDAGSAIPSPLFTLSPMVPFLLRTGRADQAWDRLQQELPPSPFAAGRQPPKEIAVWSSAPFPEPHAVLALLHARRGRAADAAGELERARTLAKPGTLRSPFAADSDPAGTWHGKLIRTLLLVEAEKAVAALTPKTAK